MDNGREEGVRERDGEWAKERTEGVSQVKEEKREGGKENGRSENFGIISPEVYDLEVPIRAFKVPPVAPVI